MSNKVYPGCGKVRNGQMKYLKVSPQTEFFFQFPLSLSANILHQ